MFIMKLHVQNCSSLLIIYYQVLCDLFKKIETKNFTTAFSIPQNKNQTWRYNEYLKGCYSECLCQKGKFAFWPVYTIVAFYPTASIVKGMFVLKGKRLQVLVIFAVVTGMRGRLKQLILTQSLRHFQSFMGEMENLRWSLLHICLYILFGSPYSHKIPVCCMEGNGCADFFIGWIICNEQNLTFYFNYHFKSASGH